MTQTLPKSLHANNYFKHFPHLSSLISHRNGKQAVPSYSLFYKWGIWGPERESEFSIVTQQISGRTRNRINFYLSWIFISIWKIYYFFSLHCPFRKPRPTKKWPENNYKVSYEHHYNIREKSLGPPKSSPWSQNKRNISIVNKLFPIWSRYFYEFFLVKNNTMVCQTFSVFD